MATTVTPPERTVSADEAREVAEAAREQEWAAPSFVRDLFLGQLRLDLVHPYPEQDAEEVRRAQPFLDRLERFLREQVDSDRIDREGEIPEAVIQGLRELGAFGIKIPREYGGLGLSQLSYMRAIALVSSIDGSITALLSAHQSIGVPQPLKMFGSEGQKKKYLPLLAKGAISAFALTEPGVGSDPAAMETMATPSEDGKAWILNGEKLWCTNGTKAELMVVMARTPSKTVNGREKRQITAFIVETAWPGVKVEHRCHFMGLKAIYNGVISFRNVRVPRENLMGEEGKGLRIALTTLNTGRLTLPAVCAGIAKQCLKIVRGWSNARQQWGVPIWKHEAVAHMIADMAATTFAMDSVWRLASQMADRGGYDIRLEAAAAKEWNMVRAWEIVDKTLQIRGGRGYETESSLRGRGEHPIPVERMMRDCRINLIFEGSSEIMHLFMAREAVDKHLEVAGAMIDPKKGTNDKLGALGGILGFYAKWYPPLWLKGLGAPFQYGDWGVLAPHLRFVERSCRKLARESFHGMAVYQAKMERKQGFLFRAVDVVMELFAMSAALCRARGMLDQRHPEALQAVELADLFCRNSRRKVRRLFHDLWSNDDTVKNRLATSVMAGRHTWLEEGIFDLGLTDEAFRTQSLVELRRAAGDGAGPSIAAGSAGSVGS